MAYEEFTDFRGLTKAEADARKKREKKKKKAGGSKKSK